MAYTPEQLYELYKGGIPIADAPSAPPTPDINQMGDLSSQFQGATGYEPVDAAGYAATGHVNTGVGQGGYRENSLPGKLDPMPTRDEMGLETPTEGQQAYSMGTKQGFGYGASASAGHSGINFETRGKLDKQDKALYARQDASRQAVQEGFNPIMDAHKIAQKSGQDAVQAKLDAEMAKLTDEQAAARYMGNLNQTIVNEDMKILARETATKNKLMSDYSAALADFAASKVDPNDLWHGMSGGMRFGTAVTAFVHDFLGAKNIKTSAMDTFKGAIDRNINAQIQNINKKGEVARGFKTLYDMESARSSSAEETRARIRGFMLEAAKNHVVANMSQYKSLLATAEGRKALAQLDEEYAKNYMEVQKFVETASQARTNQDQQWVMHKNQIAVEQYRAAIAAKSQALEEKKFKDMLDQRAAAMKAAERDNTVIDPETNIGKRVFRGQLSDKEKQNTREVLINTAETNRAIADFRKLQKDGSATWLDEAGVRRWSAEGRKLADAIRMRLAHSQVKANGERATKEDVEQYLKMFPLDQVLSSGVEGIHAYAQEHTLRNANDWLQQYTQDLPEEKWIKGGDIKYFNKDMVTSGADSNELMRGGKQVTSIDNAQKLIGGPNEKINEDYLKQSGVDKDTINEDFQEVTKAKTVSVDKGLLKYSNRESPAWAAGVYILGEQARTSGPNADKAREILTKMATSNYGDVQKDPIYKDYDYNEFQLMKKYAQAKVLNFKPKTFKSKSTMDSSNEGVDFSAGQGPLGTNPTDIN